MFSCSFPSIWLNEIKTFDLHISKQGYELSRHSITSSRNAPSHLWPGRALRDDTSNGCLWDKATKQSETKPIKPALTKLYIQTLYTRVLEYYFSKGFQAFPGTKRKYLIKSNLH